MASPQHDQHDQIDRKSRLPRGLGLLAGFAALAALPALGLGAYAAADTTTGENGSGGAPAVRRVVRAPLSDEQEQCLADHGVTLPDRSAKRESGVRPQPPTDEQRAGFRAAAQECNLPMPAHGPRPGVGSGDGTTTNGPRETKRSDPLGRSGRRSGIDQI
jgi:hypothetical protein